MCVSLITLGSTSTSELAQTIRSSMPFAENIVSQWIFVLYSSDEVLDFTNYLSRYNLCLSRFDYSVTWENTGIAASMNKGISYVKYPWTLIVHAGDFLLDLDESCYTSIITILTDPTQSLTLQVFGSQYDNGNGSVSMTNHHRKRNYFESIMPWIPHESTFVPSEFYLSRQYDINYRSAMDFDFFHSLFIEKVAFRTHPFAITVFRLGGTSSDVLLSSLEYRRSIVQNKTFRKSLLTYVLSWFYFFYIYISKTLFLCKSRLSGK